MILHKIDNDKIYSLLPQLNLLAIKLSPAVVPFSPLFNKMASMQSLSNSKLRERDEATVTSYLREREWDRARFAPFQLQSGRDSIVISTSRQTTKAFPTPGDTIVPDVATTRVLSRKKKRETRLYLSLRISEADVSVDAGLFLSKIVDEESAENRNVSDVALKCDRSASRKRHKSTSCGQVRKVNDLFFKKIYQIRKCTMIQKISTVFCNNFERQMIYCRNKSSYDLSL